MAILGDFGFGVSLGVSVWGFIFQSLGFQKYLKNSVKEGGGNGVIFVKGGRFWGDSPPHNTF